MNKLIQSLEKPEKDICIYALLDPNTNLLMYIGQTMQGFNRIRQHYYGCEKRNPNGLLSKSKVWIHNLKKENKIFKVIYLEYFNNDLKIDEAEQYWINFFKASGAELLNSFNSGSFNRGSSISKEDRELISKRTKEAMNTPEMKQKCRENIKKQRELGQIKPNNLSKESKLKISKAQESKVIYIQDDLGNTYRGLKAAAKGLNVTFGTIWKALNGYCKTVKGRTLTKKVA